MSDDVQDLCHFFKLYRRRENIKHTQLHSNVSQHTKINTPIKTNLKKIKRLGFSFPCRMAAVRHGWLSPCSPREKRLHQRNILRQ